jgi:GNAT superfamily N-acetyltransferase
MMKLTKELCHVEPALLAAWVHGRSIARGLPQPIPDHGGLRVDTGLPAEARRYVFPGPLPCIREIALSNLEPGTFIKMCGPSEELLNLVQPCWVLQPRGYFMTYDGAYESVPIPPAGYRLEVFINNAVSVARILTEGGSLAASGYAAEYDGVFVFDRIKTEVTHRRLGLGRILMAALGAMQKSSAARRVLVATEDGHRLYSKLGWTTVSHYSTVAIVN